MGVKFIDRDKGLVTVSISGLEAEFHRTNALKKAKLDEDLVLENARLKQQLEQMEASTKAMEAPRSRKRQSGGEPGSSKMVKEEPMD